MSPFVLVLLLHNYGAAMATIDMPSQAACEAAMARFQSPRPNVEVRRDGRVHAVCVDRRETQQ